MDASDPVSCLLCLSAYERSTMLRVHLRAIASDSTSIYYFCQKCGGAIAAEYLYVQNSGKEVSAAEPHDPQDSERLNVDGRGLQNTAAQTDPTIEAAAPAGVGEVETTNVPSETAMRPQKSQKEGRKGAH